MNRKTSLTTQTTKYYEARRDAIVKFEKDLLSYCEEIKAPKSLVKYEINNNYLSFNSMEDYKLRYGIIFGSKEIDSLFSYGKRKRDYEREKRLLQEFDNAYIIVRPSLKEKIKQYKIKLNQEKELFDKQSCFVVEFSTENGNKKYLTKYDGISYYFNENIIKALQLSEQEANKTKTQIKSAMESFIKTNNISIKTPMLLIKNFNSEKERLDQLNKNKEVENKKQKEREGR